MRKRKMIFCADDMMEAHLKSIAGCYKQAMGKDPSMTDIIKVLIKSHDNKKMKRKPRSKNEIQFY